MFALSIVTRAKKVLNGQLQSFNITNQISTSNHGIRKKPKNPCPGTREKMSRVTVQRKKKKVFWVKKKEKTNLVLLLEKNQGVLSQWPKENQKTLREYCNATITKVLNIKQWSQI